MKSTLVDILACPTSGSSLELKIDEYDEQRGEVKTGKLVSAEGKVYEIRDYVPRFVSSDDYAGSFSMQWTIHKTTQYASKNNPFSENQLAEISGWSPEQVRGKWILDAGCGSGRFVDILERWGANVVGIDLSYAIDAAQQVLGGRTNVHLAQASVFDLPFKKECFDFVWSYGVLMATPDTKRAFDSLVPYLKPDGQLAIWIYSSYNKWYNLCSDTLRVVTTRLPKRLLYYLCYLSVPLYYIYKIPLIGHFLRNTFIISMRKDARWRVLETFDWYSPTYQWKHRYPEVFEWFKEHRLSLCRMSRIPIGMVGVRQTEPATAGADDAVESPETSVSV